VVALARLTQGEQIYPKSITQTGFSTKKSHPGEGVAVVQMAWRSNGSIPAFL